MQPIGKVHPSFEKVNYMKARITQKKLSQRVGQEIKVLNTDRLMETIPLRLQVYRLKLVNGIVLVLELLSSLSDYASQNLIPSSIWGKIMAFTDKTYNYDVEYIVLPSIIMVPGTIVYSRNPISKF